MTMREEFEAFLRKEIRAGRAMPGTEAAWQDGYRAGQEAVAAHIEKYEPDGKRIAATIRASLDAARKAPPTSAARK
jgi:molybdopterin biosynthesis enzyme